ncbi:MAG: rhomboid family intramembrane serine protease [Spirochaetales bacterium]|nr:rhomboid family intramembrane serine protease [Spirochaetales bacterium]
MSSEPTLPRESRPQKKGLRFSFNSPLILTYTLISGILIILYEALGPVGQEITNNYFTVPGNGSGFNPVSWEFFRLFSHAFGHGSWSHFFGNFTIILLIGPVLEERYGSGLLGLMIFVTALFTGVLNSVFFSTGLLGASGIAFFMIILISFTNIRKGEIPLTMILVALIYLGKEIFEAMNPDTVSQFAHLFGGAMGIIFGFLFANKGGKGKSVEDSIS